MTRRSALHPAPQPMEPPSRGGAAPARDVCALVVPDAATDAEWDALALATRAAPFLRPGWVRAWTAAFAPRRRLHLFTVRRDGALVAVLPVLRTPRGAVTPTNSETPMMAPVAVDGAAARALVPALLAQGWAADLRFLPDGDAAADLLAEVERRGLRVRRELVRRSPYAEVDGDWDTFQREVMSGNRRRSIRRRQRILDDLGEVTVEDHDGRADLGALLDEGFGMELSGWKGAEGSAVLSRPDTAQFYRAVAEWAAQVGILRLYFLRLDGRPVAFAYQLEQHDVNYGIKTAHAEEFRQHGPGVLMMYRLLERAFERPDLRLVEWLGEDEPYKLDFASGVREQLRLRIYTPGFAGAADRAVAGAVSAARAEARRRLTPEMRQRIVVSVRKVRALVPAGRRAQATGRK